MKNLRYREYKKELIQCNKGTARDNWRGRSGNNYYYINSTRKNYLPPRPNEEV